MRKIIAVLLAVAVSVSVCGYCAVCAASETKVVAYYFHGAFRCYTCNVMEQYIKEVMKENFKDALAEGKLEFKPTNVEERGNEHFIKDYQLYSKALILSLVKDGKEARSRNLMRIWEYAGNKKRFFDYVTAETNALLEEAK